MRKRLLSTMLALCMVLALLPPGTAWAEETSGKCGDNLTWSYSDGTLTIQGTGRMEDFAIGHEPWLDYREQIHTVIIDDGVTSIGNFAFYACDNLTSVDIPNSVTSIGEDAFSNCMGLTDITIPNSVTAIGSGAFTACVSLTHVTIPNGVTSIEMDLFWECSSLTSVTIPNSVTTIGTGAFLGCESLTSVTIPHGVTSIEVSAFFRCHSLTSIIIPSSVTSISTNAFAFCSNLTSVTIPESVTTIGDSAFSYCNSLTDVYYGGSKDDWASIVYYELNRVDWTSIEKVDRTNSNNDPLLNATIHYGNPEESAVSVTDVTLDRTSLNLTVGDSEKLVAKITYTAVSNNHPDVTWTSSDESVVTVSKSGTSIWGFGGSVNTGNSECTVKAVGAGTATVTAKSGSKTATCTVTVQNAPAGRGKMVIFCPNGGMISEMNGHNRDELLGNYDLDGIGVGIEQTTKAGLMYTDASGKLPGFPTATRAGYTFDGWYVVPESDIPESIRGDDAEPEFMTDFGSYQKASLSSTYQELTYFAAKWTKANEEAQAVSLKGLTYRFGNNGGAFGYSSGYRIPLSRYQMVFGNTALAQSLYNSAGTWGGSCYAMVATSGMFFQDGDVPESSFRSGAEVPYDLTVSDKNSSMNLTLTEYIESVFVSQYAYTIQSDYGVAADLNTLCAAVAAFQKTGKNAPVIAIWGAEGGHAVLGYDVVDISSTESHLMIYDPNFPNTERYITLRKSGGQYVSWSYKLNDMYDWGSGARDGKINYIPYADYLGVWAGRAKRTASSAAMLSTSAHNISIANSAGTVVATVRDGELTTSSANIYSIRTIGLTSDGGGTSSGTLISLPVGEYTVSNTGTEARFEVTMVDVEQSATVATSASSVTFLVDDDKTTNSVQVNGAGESYDITLFSTLDQGYEEVVATGTTSAAATAVAQVSGKLYETNLDTKGTIKADGADISSILADTAPDAVPDTVPDAVPDTVPDAPTWASPFTDVTESDWFYADVAYVVQRGLMNGVGNQQFNPGGTTTRGMIMTILARMNGVDTSGGNPWYQPGMEWAMEAGVSDGTNPEGEITREQFATMLWRYAGEPVASGDLSAFSDAGDVHDWAGSAMIWAVQNDIIRGSYGSLNPQGNALRSEAAAMLTRFCQNIEK